MPGNWSNIASLAQSAIAFRSGSQRTVRGAADIHTAAKYYGNRYGNAALVGVPTAIGDTYVHVSHDRSPYVEHILTGAVSAFLALAASFLLEDRARCIRAAWTPVFG
jgi:hypothetical protein